MNRIIQEQLEAGRQVDIVMALQTLRPRAQWSLNGSYGTLNWVDEEQDKPSEQEVLNEIERLTDVQTQLNYRGKRKDEYPPIQDQLDMLWHAMDEDVLPKVDGFYDLLKSVKDKYPKL